MDSGSPFKKPSMRQKRKRKSTLAAAYHRRSPGWIKKKCQNGLSMRWVHWFVSMKYYMTHWK